MAAATVLAFAPRAQPTRAEAPSGWGLATLCGRLGQLSGTGSLSVAVALVRDAQQRGEPVAWVHCGEAPLYPPDLPAAGVDLQALVVVLAPDLDGATRAGDLLLRSGAFGLLVVDLATASGLARALAQGREVVTMAAQSRWIQLAQRHQAAVLVLTGEQGGAAPPASLSSLVSWRGRVRRQRVGDPASGETRFRCEIETIKDKRRGPGGRTSVWLRPVPGLS